MSKPEGSQDIDSLYLDGVLYDRTFRVDMDLPWPDQRFWARQAERYGKQVLELGSGTGRVAVPLARAGCQVTGLDYSAAMIVQAQRRVEKAGVRVEFVEGDMRDFHLGQTFDLVLLPKNTLCHLLTPADFTACLACVREHLRPDGAFILDVLVPSLKDLAHDPLEERPLWDTTDPATGSTIHIRQRSQYDPHTHVDALTFTYYLDGQVDRCVELHMRMYFPEELDTLLEENGFRLLWKAGDYAETPFGPEACLQLVASRPG